MKRFESPPNARLLPTLDHFLSSPHCRLSEKANSLTSKGEMRKECNTTFFHY